MMLRTSVLLRGLTPACVVSGVAVALILAIPSGLSASQPSTVPHLRDPFNWESTTVEMGGDLNGACWGVHNGAVIAAGGEVGTIVGMPQFSESVHLRPNGAGGSFSAVGEVAVPEPFAYGSSASAGNGVICVGGITSNGFSKAVFRLAYNSEKKIVSREDLPPLPSGRAHTGAAIHDSVLYVAGGTDRGARGAPLNSILSLPLVETADGRAGEWTVYSEWPGEGRFKPLISVQFDGFGDSLILVGGSGPGGTQSVEVLSLNLKEGDWNQLRDVPVSSEIASVVNVGVAHVYALPKDHGGGPLSFAAYHTITNTWTETEALPFAGTPLALLKEENSLLVISEGIESQFQVSIGIPPKLGKSMHTIDYLIIAGYLAVLVSIGFYFSRREATTDDFFRGGKRIPGWVAGISILGTRWSAISFMSVPAKSFATNWLYYLNQLGHVFALFFVVRYFLTFFCKLDVTTAYEYLGRRFGVVVRTIGSVKFVLFDIFRMGVLILLPSMVLSVITGIQIYYCILVIGFVSTLYTYLGGIEAVIWSDVIQFCIMIGGVLVATGVALYRVDDPLGAISFAAEGGKFKVLDWKFNFSTLTVWVFLISLPGHANEEVSAQYVVQRFVSAKNQRHATTSAWWNGVGGPLLISTFFFIGTAMWIFYQAHPEELNPLMRQSDEVLAWFVVEQLPVGISGLMIGAIFAATMSSLDSALSSTTTVIINDGYRHFKKNVTEESALKAARRLTFILGVVGTGSALLLAAMQVRSLLDFTLELLSLMGGGLAGIFYLGMFTTRAGTKGTVVGFIASVVILYLFKFYTEFSFFLYGAVGVVSCAVVGYIASIIFESEDRELSGLTVHTLEEK